MPDSMNAKDETALLLSRIRRLYKRIGAATEPDLAKFPARRLKTDRFFGVYQDFRGGMTDEDIEDQINWILRHIAHLRNYFFKWAGNNDTRKGEIEKTIDHSFELRVCLDLADNEKHAGPRGPGRSGRSPRLGQVGRVLRMRPEPKRRSAVTIQLDLRTGRLITKSSGGGKAAVVYEGEVLDAGGHVIGDVFETLLKAVAAWEALFKKLGIQDVHGPNGNASV